MHAPIARARSAGTLAVGRLGQRAKWAAPEPRGRLRRPLAPRRAGAPNKDTRRPSPHPVFIRWLATPMPSSSACAQAFGSRPLSVPRSPRFESPLTSSVLTSQESVSSFARPPVPAKVDIFADDDSSAEVAPKESAHGKKRREREAKKDADATDGKSRRITPEVTPCCAA